MDSLLVAPPGAYLRYLDLPGDGVPVVWIHGLGCAASADFASVASDPALRSHRSLLIDLLGHGYSDAPEGFSYTLEDHARTVGQLMDHLSLTGSAVFGHSMGGSVAITLAALRPDLVSRLIVAEANLDPGGGYVSTRIADQTEREFEASGHHALVDWLLAEGWVTRAATFRACSTIGLYRSAAGLVHGTQPTMRERLYAFEGPRAFIFGDRNLPDPEFDRLKGERIEVVAVPNAGHDMVFDNPRGVAECVAQALGSTAPRRRTAPDAGSQPVAD
jgi:pimeloyl-ACP methyl ester carboxylesterase